MFRQFRTKLTEWKYQKRFLKAWNKNINLPFPSILFPAIDARATDAARSSEPHTVTLTSNTSPQTGIPDRSTDVTQSSGLNSATFPDSTTPGLADVAAYRNAVDTGVDNVLNHTNFDRTPATTTAAQRDAPTHNSFRHASKQWFSQIDPHYTQRPKSPSPVIMHDVQIDTQSEFADLQTLQSELCSQTDELASHTTATEHYTYTGSKSALSLPVLQLDRSFTSLRHEPPDNEGKHQNNPPHQGHLSHWSMLNPTEAKCHFDEPFKIVRRLEWHSI